MLEAEQRRLHEKSVNTTLRLIREPWGERLFQVTDLNGIIAQLVEWIT